MILLLPQRAENFVVASFPGKAVLHGIMFLVLNIDSTTKIK